MSKNYLLTYTDLMNIDFTPKMVFWKRDFDKNIIYLEKPYHYPIELQNIDSPDKAYNMIKHMNEKTWFAPQMLSELCYLLEDQLSRLKDGINIH